MNITFHGAARSVTGSRHLIDGPEGRILLDCGMFQGRREEADRRNRYLGFDPRSIHAVLLSHAHIDHSGGLPILTKHGFRGDVHMMKATADLAAVMLEDSARVQEADCAYVNKKEGRWGEASLEPFYNRDDTGAIVRRFIGSEYDRAIRIAPGLAASFHEAGHIFGSAAIRLKYSAGGRTKTILFSGDLGRPRMPVIKDPAPPPPCDVLIIESTYGDRLHEEAGEALKAKAAQLVAHAKLHRSKIIVPAFAVGRTQDIIMRIKELVGDEYTVKDLRTWHGTVLGAAAFVDADPPVNKTVIKRVESAVMKEVAEELGNTPAVARSSYVDPRVVEGYEAGMTIAAGVRRAERKRAPAERQAILESSTARLIRKVAKG